MQNVPHISRVKLLAESVLRKKEQKTSQLRDVIGSIEKKCDITCAQASSDPSGFFLSIAPFFECSISMNAKESD